MAKRQSGIYKIENIINNKIYLGMSINISKRWESHRHSLKYGIHPNKHLQNSYNKYGAENFKYCILEEIEDKSEIVKRELELIHSLNLLNPKIGYNKSGECGPILSEDELIKRKMIFPWFQTKRRIEMSGLESVGEFIRSGVMNQYEQEDIWLISDLCNIHEEIVNSYCSGINFDLDNLTIDKRIELTTPAPTPDFNKYPCCGCGRFNLINRENIGFCSHFRIVFNVNHSYVSDCKHKICYTDDIFKKEYGNSTIDDITEKWLNGEII